MRVSAKKVNPSLEKEIFNLFYQLISDIKNPQEAKIVFDDVLSKNEKIAIAKRLGILYWLSKGRGPSNIRENLKVSLATISDLQKKIKRAEGLKLALKKIQAEEWANRWTEKIRSLTKIFD